MKDFYESFIAIRNPLEVLENDNSVSIHKRNLHFFAIETFKFKRGFSAPALCKEIIPQNRQNRLNVKVRDI